MKAFTCGALLAAGVLIGCGAGSKSDYTGTPAQSAKQPSGSQNLNPGIGNASDGLAIPAPAGTGGSGTTGQQQGKAVQQQDATPSNQRNAETPQIRGAPVGEPLPGKADEASPARGAAAGHRGVPGANEPSTTAGGQSQEPGANLPPAGSP